MNTNTSNVFTLVATSNKTSVYEDIPPETLALLEALQEGFADGRYDPNRAFSIGSSFEQVGRQAKSSGEGEYLDYGLVSEAFVNVLATTEGKYTVRANSSFGKAINTFGLIEDISKIRNKYHKPNILANKVVNMNINHPTLVAMVDSDSINITSLCKAKTPNSLVRQLAKGVIKHQRITKLEEKVEDLEALKCSEAIMRLEVDKLNQISGIEALSWREKALHLKSLGFCVNQVAIAVGKHRNTVGIYFKTI